MVGALWTDAELEAGVVLDGVVVVADARNLGRQLAAAREPGAVNEAARQLAYADVVLLNKVGAFLGLSHPVRVPRVQEAVHLWERAVQENALAPQAEAADEAPLNRACGGLSCSAQPVCQHAHHRRTQSEGPRSQRWRRRPFVSHRGMGYGGV